MQVELSKAVMRLTVNQKPEISWSTSVRQSIINDYADKKKKQRFRRSKELDQDNWLKIDLVLFPRFFLNSIDRSTFHFWNFDWYFF